MPLNFDTALGIHPEALKLRSQRNAMLAANLANADTPNYKAKDVDFKAALKQAAGNTQMLPMKTTHSQHIEMNSGGFNPTIKYRQPSAPSLDGNTVDTQVEKAEFAKNAVDYQATLRFLNGKFSGLLTALKGQS